MLKPQPYDLWRPWEPSRESVEAAKIEKIAQALEDALATEMPREWAQIAMGRVECTCPPPRQVAAAGLFGFAPGVGHVIDRDPACPIHGDGLDGVPH